MSFWQHMDGEACESGPDLSTADQYTRDALCTAHGRIVDEMPVSVMTGEQWEAYATVYAERFGRRPVRAVAA